MSKDGLPLWPTSLFRPAVVAAAATVAALAWGATPAGAVGPPSPSFSFAPSSPVTGQQVRFDATATTEPNPPGPSQRRYEWDFNGDGVDDAEGAVVANVFGAPGTYPVRLRVTSTDGVTQASLVRNVFVAANRPPLAGFYPTPSSPGVNTVIRLTSTSSDPDGRIRSQTWDLDGDGAFNDASGPVAYAVFNSPGRRLLRLLVVDDSGAFTVSSAIITIGEPRAAAFPLMNPFPVVRIAGSVTRRGARIRVLSVTAAAGARVVVRCRGRLCPRRRAVTRTRRTGRPVRIRRFERRLQAGVVLEVFVSRPGVIGKYTRFRIRRGATPTRLDGCLPSRTTRRISCPRR